MHELMCFPALPCYSGHALLRTACVQSTVTRRPALAAVRHSVRMHDPHAYMQALKDLGEERAVAQEYIRRPMLIHGLKFDIRLYALVLCAEPLDVFVFRQGLVRFATVPYRPPTTGNLSTQRMHLTNYAVNRRAAGAGGAAAHFADVDAAVNGSASPPGADSAGSEQCAIKWGFETLFEYLDANGEPAVSTCSVHCHVRALKS